MERAIERATPSAHSSLPAVRRVAAGQPLRWLRQGLDDMLRLGFASLGHGVFVAAFGVVMLVLGWAAPYLVPAFAGGSFASAGTAPQPVRRRVLAKPFFV